MTTITIRAAKGRRVRTPAGALLDGPVDVTPGMYWDRLLAAGDVEKVVATTGAAPATSPRAAAAADTKDR